MRRPHFVRRVLAVVAIAALWPMAAHALVVDSATIDDAHPVIDKDYPPIPGQFPSPRKPYAAIGADACRVQAWCSVIDLTLDSKFMEDDQVTTGFAMRLTWSDDSDLDLFLWSDETDGATNMGLIMASTVRKRKTPEQVYVSELPKGLYHVVVLNAEGANLGFHLRMELVEYHLPDLAYIRPSPGAPKSKLSTELVDADALQIAAGSPTPAGRKIKVPGQDGPSGDQSLSVLTRGQKGTRTETVLSPVALGVIVLVLVAGATVVYAYIKRRRAE